jgi:hypothetical protein
MCALCDRGTVKVCVVIYRDSMRVPPTVRLSPLSFKRVRWNRRRCVRNASFQFVEVSCERQNEYTVPKRWSRTKRKRRWVTAQKLQLHKVFVVVLSSSHSKIYISEGVYFFCEGPVLKLYAYITKTVKIKSRTYRGVKENSLNTTK